MEDNKKSGVLESEKEIVYSQTIKAGKRIYYIDVKRNRRDEMYLSITESKKIIQGEGEGAPITFEKHKIFLYREDFAKFQNSLNEAIGYVVAEQGEYIPHHQNEFSPTTEKEEKQNEKVDIDIEF
jgi:DNA-directed RNA polymerase subunit F